MKNVNDPEKRSETCTEVLVLDNEMQFVLHLARGSQEAAHFNPKELSDTGLKIA